MVNSEVGAAEDVVKAFMETLVDPTLPRSFSKDPPSEDNQESVAKQVVICICVLFYTV